MFITFNFGCNNVLAVLTLPTEFNLNEIYTFVLDSGFIKMSEFLSFTSDH